MNARLRHPHEQVPHRRTADIVRGRRRRLGIARLVLIMAISGLAPTLLVLGAPDHELTRAVARPTHATGRTHTRPRLTPGGPISMRAAQSTGFRNSVPDAQVTIATGGPAMRVPQSYFGLSTEYWALPLYERHLTAFERVLSTLQAGGAGPLILRIGGDSADHTYWQPAVRRMPRWFFRLTPAWFRPVSRVVSRLHLRVIVNLNLVANAPQMAARWARAALTDLPRGSVVGFEIGNEPDDYHLQHWHRLESSPQARVTTLVPKGYSARSYIRSFGEYARALGHAGSRVPLIGPAVAEPQLAGRWLSSLIAAEHSALGVVSAHRYPLSACQRWPSPRYPTIARVLGDGASAGMARTITTTAALSHRAGLAFRLSEINSVTCGGLRGVSDTFATALWAPDALFELMRRGVDSVNVHVRADAINAPFTVTRSGLRSHPFLYGLIMFTRTLGPDPQLLRARIRAKRSLNLKAWAVRVHGNSLHVLLIDKGKGAVRVDLHLAASGIATVERLLAPSPRSQTNVTLDRQHLGHDGRWVGAPSVEAIAPTAGRYEVDVPGTSAALLEVQLPGGPPVTGAARTEQRGPAT